MCTQLGQLRNQTLSFAEQPIFGAVDDLARELTLRADFFFFFLRVVGVGGQGSSNLFMKKKKKSGKVPRPSQTAITFHCKSKVMFSKSSRPEGDVSFEL